MKHMVLLLGCLLLAPFSTQAGELYRWIDKAGKVHYGNSPTAGAEQVEQKRFSDAQEGEEMLYETYLARQNFPVTLYTAANCIEPCQQARDFLDQRGIPYTEKALITQKEADDFKRQSGIDQAPTIAVGRIYLAGFQSTQWGNELDIAGYPKALPYRIPREPAKYSADKPAAGK